MGCVFSGRRSLRHHLVVARPLALSAQSPLSDPHERMEPVECADESSQEVAQRVAARYVCQLVTQHDTTMIFRPVEGVFRKKNYRRAPSPRKRRAHYWTRAELDRLVDACVVTFLAEHSCPLVAGKAPRHLADAMQSDAAGDQPADHDGESEHPN